MYLDLEPIDAAGRLLDCRLELHESNDETGQPLLSGPAVVRGRAWRGPRGVELEARLEAAARLACSRCLEPFEWPIATSFALRLLPGEPGASELPPTAEDDPDLVTAPNGRADLGAIAAEQVYLSLPLKPLCSPECRGLCPTCGANRNRLECGCPEPEPDPRLSPLRDIRNRMGGR